MKISRRYAVIFSIMFTEVLGFSIILPFLPFFAQELGASALEIGLILMSFSFFQFLSAPILGQLSDRYGRKPLLLISQFSTFIGFIILAFANSLWLIILSRVVDGLFGSNYNIAQAYISDITPKNKRSKIFSFTGTAFGIGFTIGPALGGFLSSFGYAAPSFLAAAISLSTMFLTAFMLPETITSGKQSKLVILPTKQLRRYFSNKKVSPVLSQFTAFIFTHAIFVSVIPLYADWQLGFDAQAVGFALMYVGISNILLRLVVVPKLIGSLGERKLRYFGATSTILSLIIAAFITDWFFFAIGITLFAFGASSLRPILTATIANNVADTEQGSVMGVTSSLQSISQIIGPLIGGLALNYFWPGSVGLISAGFMAIGLFIMVCHDRKGKCMKLEISASLENGT